MKKNGKLSQALVFVLILPIAVLMALFLILYMPIDFIRYCYSNRRKEMKRSYGKRAKYTWLVTLTDHYRIYEMVSKSSLPILFIPENENPCDYGYFYCDGTLFLPDVVPHFDLESESWYIVQGHDESNMSAYIETEKEAFQKCTGYNENARCENVVFLVKEKDVYDEEKEMIENVDFIVTYNKKNFAEKIKAFLSK